MKSLVVFFLVVLGGASCDVRYYENRIFDMASDFDFYKDLSSFDNKSAEEIYYENIMLLQSSGCPNSLVENTITINPFTKAAVYSKCEADYLLYVRSKNLLWAALENSRKIKIEFSYKAKFYLVYDINVSASAYYLDSFDVGILNSNGTKISLGTISGYDIQKDQRPDRSMSIIYNIPRLLPGDDILGIYVHVISQNRNVMSIVIPDAYYAEKTKFEINSIQLIDRFQ